MKSWFEVREVGLAGSHLVFRIVADAQEAVDEAKLMCIQEPTNDFYVVRVDESVIWTKPIIGIKGERGPGPCPEGATGEELI